MDVFSWLVSAAAAISGALAFLYVWTAVNSRIRAEPNEVLTAVTDDGHQLPIYRHHPPPAYGPPRGAVLCLHGLGANHFNLDFPGSHNLARWLADSGLDVYVASYRGDVDAVGPPGGGAGLTFDSYVNLDMPALLAQVKTHSGFEQVHLVGHSMGGMLAYAFAGAHGQMDVGSITTVASPVGFTERTAVAADLLRFRTVLTGLPWLPVRWLARAVAPFLTLVTGSTHIRRQVNTDNVDWGLLARAMWHSVSNVPRGVVMQFEDWIVNDVFRSADGAVDYREKMAGITVPVCILAGSMDVLARPHNALRAEALVGSIFKEATVLGPETGCQNGYGHIDLLFGLYAPQEVFPRVAAFIHKAGDGMLGVTSKDVGLA